GSRLAARGSRLAARGSRLAARGSRLAARGSRLWCSYRTSSCLAILGRARRVTMHTVTNHWQELGARPLLMDFERASVGPLKWGLVSTAAKLTTTGAVSPGRWKEIV
ncbi:hypothetical protein ACIQAC_38735, partial [Streptomyces sp. NPDC088387]